MWAPVKGWGVILILRLAGGYHLVLAGLDKTSVAVGQSVAAGPPVGWMPDGRQSEGRSTELYLEVREQGAPVDPGALAEYQSGLSVPVGRALGACHKGGFDRKEPTAGDEEVPLIGVSAFVLGAGSMAYVSQHAMAAASPKASTYRMLGLFGDVLDTVERQYVTPVDDTKLIHAALDGMLTSLDPHSGYLDPESFDDMRDQTRGEYGGLGLEVTTEDGVVKVISPMDDTPRRQGRREARRLHHRGQRRQRARPVGQ